MAGRGRNLKTICLRAREKKKDVGFKRLVLQSILLTDCGSELEKPQTDLLKAERGTLWPQIREAFMRPDRPTFTTESGTEFHVCIFCCGFHPRPPPSIFWNCDWASKGEISHAIFSSLIWGNKELFWGWKAIHLCLHDIGCPFFFLRWNFYMALFPPSSMIFNIHYFFSSYHFPKTSFIVDAFQIRFGFIKIIMSFWSKHANSSLTVI